MNELFFADARTRADLFRPFKTAGNAMPNDGNFLAGMEDWLRRRNIGAPPDLLSVWRQYTYGLDFFESETLLGPLGDAPLGNDVIGVNELLWARGMPSDYLVFHRGLGDFSAVRQGELVYVQLRADGFREHGAYPTFEEWYRRIPRDEFATRYGLPPP